MCGGCVKTITATLQKLDGVQEVRVVHDAVRKEGVISVNGTVAAAALISALKAKGKSAVVISSPSGLQQFLGRQATSAKLLAATGIAAWAAIAAVALLKPAASARLANMRPIPSLVPVETTQLVASRIVPMAHRLGFLVKGALNNLVSHLPAIAQLQGSAHTGSKS